MVGILTALQFALYETTKEKVGNFSMLSYRQTALGVYRKGMKRITSTAGFRTGAGAETGNKT